MSSIHIETTMDQERVVLYAAPGMGHLVSLVEFGKRLLHQRPSLSITVLTTTLPFDYSTSATVAYISSISAAFPSINFHPLPTLSTLRPPATYSHTEDILFELIPRNNAAIRQLLLQLSLSSHISAFVIDFFCTSALHIGKSLNIPTYFFFISGASALTLFLNFPTIDKTTTTTKKFHSSKVLFSIPGLPQIPVTALPNSMLEKGDTYKKFVDIGVEMAKSDGVIVNSFKALEPRAVKALVKGDCKPEGSKIPPVYCVGPLISMLDDTKHECLHWLDRQPSRSVIFVCFGSTAVFQKCQLEAIAIGLERSGHRFLWVVKDPPPLNDKSKRFTRPPDPDLKMILPFGFMDRTKERGLVVKTWAPQKAVLGHDSVGAFVSHCGWNSTLEAVWFGVPLVGWPLFAEQRFNQIVLVEEVRVALPMMDMVEDGGRKMVKAEEIERRVREIMKEVEGVRLGKRMLDMKREARVAISEEGSSTVALVKLVESWNKS